MMGPDGSTFGVQYVQQSIRFAVELGCPMVDTVDGAIEIEGLSKEDVFRITCDNYRQCLAWAEDYGVIINIEPHGPYTSDGDFMERLFTHFDSEYLRFNMDTGNAFIAGLDPLEYIKRFRKYLTHAHIKDVSPVLAAARGEETGIGMSEVPVGGGVNAQNIARSVEYLQADQLRRRVVDRVLRLRRQHRPQREVHARTAWVRIGLPSPFGRGAGGEGRGKRVSLSRKRERGRG